MDIPEKIPGLKLLTIVMAIYGVVWMSLEGDLTRVTAMGVVVSLTLAGHLLQRFFRGRSFNLAGWLIFNGGSGFLFGFGSALLTLVFMVMKTGLHAHGPEFRPSEIEWVLGMIPLWSLAGLVAGLGVGTLVWGFRQGKGLS